MMKAGVVLRDPTAETASELRPRQAPLESFSYTTVALMDIGKMRGDEFIDRLEELCKERESPHYGKRSPQTRALRHER